MSQPTVTSLDEFFALMKRQQFTGATIVHWANGKLKLIEFPAQRVQITEKRIDEIARPGA